MYYRTPTKLPTKCYIFQDQQKWQGKLKKMLETEKKTRAALSKLLLVQATSETFGLTKRFEMGRRFWTEVLILVPLKSTVIFATEISKAEEHPKCHMAGHLR